MAKLISEDEIEIKIQNQNGELLYRPQIVNNFIHFNIHYKPIT